MEEQIISLPHGGDWAGFAAECGALPLDFSASVSPLGLPEGVRDAAAQALREADRYPDPLCRALRRAIAAWLRGVRLRIKENWQVFPTGSRLPTALGYRFGRGYILLRKRNLLRLRRTLSRYYRRRRATVRIAAALLSRLGQLRHCSSAAVLARIYRPGTQRKLKDVIRAYARKEQIRWNMYSGLTTAAASAPC